MKINDLVSLAKASDPKLADVSDAQAALLVRAVFAELNKQIGSGSKEPVRIAGFGAFKTKEGEKEKDGQTKATKKTSFRAAAPGEGKESKEGKKEAKKEAKKASKDGDKEARKAKKKAEKAAGSTAQ